MDDCRTHLRLDIVANDGQFFGLKYFLPSFLSRDEYWNTIDNPAACG
jgi:hypothetical protein